MQSFKLNDEKDYKEFGTEVGKVLYAGKAPYRIENFFKELTKDLPESCDAAQMKKIVDHLSNMHKAQVKKEKDDRDKKKGKPKATLKGGAAKGYERNNNTAMVNDVMGGEEYGEYGDETGAATFKREEEADYDFM